MTAAGRKGKTTGGGAEKSLRKRAVDRMKKEKPGSAASGIPEDPERLIHELRVHQIELEMQNEELTRSRTEAERLRDQYIDLYESAPAGYLTLDPDGTILNLNLRAAELLGQERKRITGGRMRFFLNPHDSSIPVFNTFFESVRMHDGRERIEATLARDEQETRYVMITGQRTTDPDGNRKVLLVIADITERKALEEMVHERERFTKEIISNAKEGIIVYDRNFNYLVWNSFMESLTGFSAPEVVGKNAFDLFPHLKEQNVHILLQRALTGETVKSPDTPYTIEKTKKSGWVSGIYSPHYNGKGEIIGVIGIVRDITERKHAEEALKQANRKLNLLSSVTRHDILNQIFALRGYLDLSRDFLNDSKKLGEFLEREEKATKTIESQIQFTKEYQDLGVASPAWQDVRGSIKRAAASLPMLNIRIDIECPDLEVYADPLFDKVFYNLIDNALRYGGDSMTTIRVSSQESDKGLTLLCEDDGVGVLTEDKKRLFEKGFGKNSGFGLFLVKEILSITGISIIENGVAGKGARFEITVPKGMYRFVGQQRESTVRNVTDH